MTEISRRDFVRRTTADAAVAALVAAGVTRLQANPLGMPIGSQTYPHRAMIQQNDFAGLCKTMADMGVERLELCSAIGYAEFKNLTDTKQTKTIMADHGLKCESAHFSMGELRKDQAASIAWAKEIGMTQMLVASLGGGNNPTMDQVKTAADEYNKMAEVAAKAGIQQGLHNEGFELAMVDGKRCYDILFELLDPKLVKFQFQMSTITAGLVGAEYFTKYPGRFISMHVQDIDMNAPLPPPPPPPDPAAPAGARRGGGGGRGRPQVAVGKGTIDWAKTFQAGKVGGIKNYFVEQAMDLTKESVAALRAMK